MSPSIHIQDCPFPLHRDLLRHGGVGFWYRRPVSSSMYRDMTESSRNCHRVVWPTFTVIPDHGVWSVTNRSDMVRRAHSSQSAVRTLSHIAMCALVSLPRDFIAVFVLSEHGIHHELEVVTGGGVAVEVDAAGRLENTVEFGHPLSHHGEVGHHVVLSKEPSHRLRGDSPSFSGPSATTFSEGDLRLDAPAPCILEGSYLSSGVFSCCAHGTGRCR